MYKMVWVHKYGLIKEVKENLLEIDMKESGKMEKDMVFFY